MQLKVLRLHDCNLSATLNKGWETENETEERGKFFTTQNLGGMISRYVFVLKEKKFSK